jgi:hypothetical protein
MRVVAPALWFAVLFLGLATPAFAVPFASEVVSYTAGANVPTGYDDPSSALGSPLRATGSGPFDGDINPFNAPYTADQVVSIGAGGSLVVRFDHPVTDDAANPYGIDLLIFGNAFLGMDFDLGLADGTIFEEPARVAVSQNGIDWIDLPLFADGMFPTLAYSSNPNGPFGSGGTNPTCYTCPVDPSVSVGDFVGLDVNAIAALYGGAGGGLGIDLAAAGLPWIEYVRVWQPAGDGYAADIDAFADVGVPEPGAVTLFGVGLALTSIRARTRRPNRRPAARR